MSSHPYSLIAVWPHEPQAPVRRRPSRGERITGAIAAAALSLNAIWFAAHWLAWALGA